MCEKLYKLKTKCTDMVEKHGDIVIDLIMKGLSAKEICRELGYCVFEVNDEIMEIDEAVHSSVVVALPEPSDLYDIVDISEKREYFPYEKSDNTVCVVCQTVMAQLETELKDKKTQEEIENTIKNICHSFPKSFNAQCSKFVDSYVGLIISLIGTMKPKEICVELKLCTALLKQLEKSNCE